MSKSAAGRKDKPNRTSAENIEIYNKLFKGGAGNLVASPYIKPLIRPGGSP